MNENAQRGTEREEADKKRSAFAFDDRHNAWTEYGSTDESKREEFVIGNLSHPVATTRHDWAGESGSKERYRFRPASKGSTHETGPAKPGTTLIWLTFVDQETGTEWERKVTARGISRSDEGLGYKLYACGRMLGASKIAGECGVLSRMGDNGCVPNWYIGIARGQIIESFHVEENYVDKKAGLFDGLVQHSEVINDFKEGS